MATHIHVVLQKDVKHLGGSGALVRVRPGFARNFLIPRGLALPATPSNLAEVEELRRQALAGAARELAAAQAVAKQLESVTVRIARSVGAEGKMYGSVTARDIEEAFQVAGVALDRKKLQLAEPIKQLGLAEVPVKIHHDVTAVARVEVVKAG